MISLIKPVQTPEGVIVGATITTLVPQSHINALNAWTGQFAQSGAMRPALPAKRPLRAAVHHAVKQFPGKEGERLHRIYTSSETASNLADAGLHDKAMEWAGNAVDAAVNGDPPPPVPDEILRRTPRGTRFNDLIRGIFAHDKTQRAQRGDKRAREDIGRLMSRRPKSGSLGGYNPVTGALMPRSAGSSRTWYNADRSGGGDGQVHRVGDAPSFAGDTDRGMRDLDAQQWQQWVYAHGGTAPTPLDSKYQHPGGYAQFEQDYRGFELRAHNLAEKYHLREEGAETQAKLDQRIAARTQRLMDSELNRLQAKLNGARTDRDRAQWRNQLLEARNERERMRLEAAQAAAALPVGGPSYLALPSPTLAPLMAPLLSYPSGSALAGGPVFSGYGPPSGSTASSSTPITVSGNNDTIVETSDQGDESSNYDDEFDDDSVLDDQDALSAAALDSYSVDNFAFSQGFCHRL